MVQQAMLLNGSIDCDSSIVAAAMAATNGLSSSGRIVKRILTFVVATLYWFDPVQNNLASVENQHKAIFDIVLDRNMILFGLQSQPDDTALALKPTGPPLKTPATPSSHPAQYNNDDTLWYDVGSGWNLPPLSNASILAKGKEQESDAPSLLNGSILSSSS